MQNIKLKNGLVLSITKAIIEDASDIIEYLNIVGGESDNLLFGKNEFHLTLEQEEQFIENINQSSTSVLVIGRIGNRIASVASVSAPVRERIAHTCEIALSVRGEFWGIGVGEAVLSFLIDFARQTDIISVIHLKVRTDNLNAIHLYEKSGFEKIGLYKNFFKINGVYCDALLMNLYI